MRVVIVENTSENITELKKYIHILLPNALVKGFTDGNEAEKWCKEHSSEVEIYFGNWWGTMEEYDTPEGSAVWKYIDWKKKPVVVCTGDEDMFGKWSKNIGADAFIKRPVTIEKIRDVLESVDI